MSEESKAERKRRKATFVARCIVDQEFPGVTEFCTTDGWFVVRLDSEPAAHEYQAYRVAFLNPKTGKTLQ